MDLTQEYLNRLYLEIDAAIQRVFALLRVSVEEVKNHPSLFQHIISPGGRQDWVWNGLQVVWIEPLKAPAYGFKISELVRQKGRR